MSAAPSKHVVGEWIRTLKVRPSEKLILMLMYDRSSPNEDGLWATWVGNSTLSDESGLAKGTVANIAVELTKAGIVRREERFRGNGSQTSSYTVLLVPEGAAIATPETPIHPTVNPQGNGVITQEGTGDSLQRGPQNHQNGSQASSPDGEEAVRERAPARRPADQGKLPDDLPEQLHDVARSVLVVLQRVHTDRGGHTPTLRGVGLAIAAFPDRDHLDVAGRLEQRYLGGAGAQQLVRDWTQTFRTFLKRTTPGSAPRRAQRPGEPARTPAQPADQRPIAPNGSPAHAALQQLRVQLRLALDNSDYDIWVAPLVPVDLGDELVLGGPPPIAVWVHDRFGPLMRKAAGRPVRVVPLAALDQRDAA